MKHFYLHFATLLLFLVKIWVIKYYRHSLGHCSLFYYRAVKTAPCIYHSTTQLFIGDLHWLTSALVIFTWESKAEEQVSSVLTAIQTDVKGMEHDPQGPLRAVGDEKKFQKTPARKLQRVDWILWSMCIPDSMPQKGKQFQKEKEIYHSKADVTAIEWSRLARDICFIL